MNPNEVAYRQCIELCKKQGWWATHTALTEDGYDSRVDFIAMHEKWLADVKGNS